MKTKSMKITLDWSEKVLTIHEPCDKDELIKKLNESDNDLMEELKTWQIKREGLKNEKVLLEISLQDYLKNKVVLISNAFDTDKKPKVDIRDYADLFKNV